MGRLFDTIVAQIQAEEDKRILQVLDEAADPICRECGERTSVGAEKRCPHCSMWEVMSL